MRGQATVEFDFDFKYSSDGDFAVANSVEVHAPGLADFKTHARMEGYIGEALKRLYIENKAAGVERHEDAARVDAASDEDKGAGGMSTVALGLGDEKFPDFLVWLKKTLTANRALACVGGTEHPVTEEVWMSIVENGGMQAVMKVLSEFVGLFFDDEAEGKSKKPPGKKSSRK